MRQQSPDLMDQSLNSKHTGDRIFIIIPPEPGLDRP
jgi:hypothetical protein